MNDLEILIPKNTCLGCKSRDEINQVLAEEIDKQNSKLNTLLRQINSTQESDQEDFSEVAA